MSFESESTSSKKNSEPTTPRAPIASMDCMEDMDLLSGGNDSSDQGSQKRVLGKPPPPPIIPEVSSSNGSNANTTLVSIPKAHPNIMSYESNSSIKYRNVGKSGLKISNLGLGSMKLFSTENQETAEEIVSLAYENGINLFDVSDPNHQDRSEQEFGRIFAKKGWERRAFNICTRVFWSKHEQRGLSRKEIIESVKQSLRNLQLEYIDLVLIHKSDPNCTMEEIVRAMTYLINSGLVMYWGTSRWSNVEIYEAHSIAKTFQCIGPVCELAEYHWFHREKVELYMAELFNRIGFGLITWSPVSYGLTLGVSTEEAEQLILKLCIKNMKYNKTLDSTSISTTEKSEPQIRLKQLNGIAEKLGCTLNQLFIAWCIRNQTSQSVIVSAATPKQFKEILNCLPIVKSLTFTLYEDLDKILLNKPARPPMISTLQQRWATTGGVPPC